MTNPLRLDLDTAQFDKLVADARALIPQLAPSWTDHNLHDPGIMLLELEAWVADQQTYALARDRQDERRAFAAAMGVHVQGPQPAAGLIWPRPDPANPAPPWPNGTPLAAGDNASLDGREGPGFVLGAAVILTTAQIAGLGVEPPGAPVQNFPAQPPPGGLAPFGAPTERGARFHIRLDGELPAVAAGAPSTLAIGVETDSPAIADSRARLSASVQVGANDIALPVTDGTHALGQSGVLLLDLTPLAGQAPAAGAVITLTLEAALRPLPAKVTRIALNVLPVRQETVGTADYVGTGLPDQQVLLRDADRPLDRVRFGGGQAPPTVVRLTGGPDEPWTPGVFETAGPGDRVFEFDPASQAVTFGNGLNGAAPAIGDQMRLTWVFCEGAQGLIPAGTSWRVQGALGQFWNPQPTAGGEDPADLTELRRDSRERARDLRPLVTDDDLVQAALAASDLRVRRAEVLDGYAPDTCARLAGATRTLVVMGRDAGAADSEPAAWLDILRRRIQPRLTLGDRVRIIRPAYVPVRMRAGVTPRSGVSPSQLQAAIDGELAKRMRLIPLIEGDAVWPLGLDLHAAAVAGWLRRLPGVAAVREVAVGAVGGALGASVVVPVHGLPVLTRESGDIAIGSAA